MSNEPHIRVEGVDAVYEAAGRPLAALAGLDLSIGRGEFVSLIGPSGCGKSTLLRIVGGLQAPSRGRVLIDGLPPRDAQRDKQVGFVFQDASLLPWRSVIDNVRLPLQVNRAAAKRANAFATQDSSSATSKRDVWSSAAKSLGSVRPVSVRPEPVEGRARPVSASNAIIRPDAAYADRLVDLVGLDAFRSYYPHQLSGGMQQRVALARSLVTAPSLLLMDEPFGALDEITRSAMRFELLRVWRAEAADRACTVLFVTHSIAEAVLLSDRVVVLTPQPGRVAAVLDVDLPRPRDESVELDAAFLDHTRRLRALLRERGVA